MITWVTVWVLTVQYIDRNTSHTYQLQYQTSSQCAKALERNKKNSYYSSDGGAVGKASCDFQQIPVVTK